MGRLLPVAISFTQNYSNNICTYCMALRHFLQSTASAFSIIESWSPRERSIRIRQELQENINDGNNLFTFVIIYSQ